MRSKRSTFNTYSVLRLLALLVLSSAFYPSCSFALEPGSSQKTTTIAVLSDGIVDQGSTASRLRSLFIEELRILTEGEFKLVFPQSKQIHSSDSKDNIRTALQRLQNDPQIDMVLALGWLPSHIAASTPSKKPTFAPFITNTKLLGLSPEGNTSGIKNLNYLSSETRFADELRSFKEVTPFTRLTLLVDKEFLELLPRVEKSIQAQAKKAGITLRFVKNIRAEEDLISQITQDTEAVMIGPLPKLKPASKKALIAGLIKRQLPAYSWMSGLSVDDGILASKHAFSHWQGLARRNALNMQAVLRGKMTRSQVVFFDKKPRLAINMATARAINISPCFDVLESAMLFNDGPDMECASLDLQSVAKTAIEQNLAIIAGKLSSEISDTNIHEARSILFPKITAQLTHVQVNADNPFVEIGLNPEIRSQASLRLEQVLFSERALTNLSIQKQLRLTRLAQQKALELDVLRNATRTYLNILIAQTRLSILKNNLSLTQAHLDLAKNRVRAGLANMAEIFRWQSEIALTRQQVLKANSAVEQTRDVLNLILHYPISERFAIQPASLNDPDLLMSQQSLLDLVTSEKEFELMNQFFVREGLLTSPKLAVITSRMDVKKIQLSSEKHSYWSPNIALFAEVSEVFDERMIQSQLGLNVSLEDLTTWQAGIRLSLPLLEGGGRQARIERSKLGLRQLHIQQQLAQESTEQEIRGRLHALHASYPAIELSQQATLAAKQSYDIVKENYINGTLRVTDLLDAQTARLVADQASANAVYTFLIDLMQLQYSIGQFDFFLNEAQKESTTKRLSEYIRSGGKN